MKIKILCTLGPSSMNDHSISRLEDLGVSLFRINLSHTKLEDVPEIISYIKKNTIVPICLDTEGAQVRSGLIINGKVLVREHSLIKILGGAIKGDETKFSLYPDYIIDQLKIGDFVSVDFDSVLLQVLETDNNIVSMRVLNGGEIGQNKAVTVNRTIKMPPLTDKDIKAIKIGREMGITHFALSFANNDKDVDLIRSHTGEKAVIISKIECRNGVNNLKKIIEHCKSVNTEVYVATNLLETMIQSSSPTRAEVNDVYTTLNSGANGLVLAAETAIGINPIACTSMIVKLIYSFEIDQQTEEGTFHDNHKSLLTEPHGGYLVQRFGNEEDKKEADRLIKVNIGIRELIDCEQIANGTYSPINGFMDRETLFSVLESNRLPGGMIWTMPIILQLKSLDSSQVKIGNQVALASDQGTIYAVLDVTDIYQINLKNIAKKWFGTSSNKHPGVSNFMAKGENCIAGTLKLIRQLPSIHRHYKLDPIQTRSLFNHKGWNKVIGFQTGNPAHRVHEYIQLNSMENEHVDGLFISPVIGPKKTGDFLPDPILRSYQILIDNGIYPEGKVVLGSFSSFPRYCGQRETIFTMLCRKNMGCSHFIIGHDNSKFGQFYDYEENFDLIESLGDIGIKPIFYDEIGYSPIKDELVEANNDKNIQKISCNEIREALKNGKKLPKWFFRTPVQDMLLNDLNQGIEIFQK